MKKRLLQVALPIALGLAATPLLRNNNPETSSAPAAAVRVKTHGSVESSLASASATPDDANYHQEIMQEPTSQQATAIKNGDRKAYTMLRDRLKEQIVRGDIEIDQRPEEYFGEEVTNKYSILIGQSGSTAQYVPIELSKQGIDLPTQLAHEIVETHQRMMNASEDSQPTQYDEAVRLGYLLSYLGRDVLSQEGNYQDSLLTDTLKTMGMQKNDLRTVVQGAADYWRRNKAPSVWIDEADSVEAGSISMLESFSGFLQ